MNIRFQVFVSSTYADLKEERSRVIQTIMELDCIPAGMELFPAIDNEQFDFIKKVIDDCDYYILIIGGRYGSLSVDGLSFTEKEYDYAIEKGINVLAFIHENPDNIPLGKSEKNEELRQKLLNFKTKVSSNRLVKFWNNANELPGLVALSLSKTIKMYPAIGWVRTNSVANPEIYQELNEIRKENSQLRETINKQKIETTSETKILADFKAVYKFSGTYRWWDNYTRAYQDNNWELEISWENLFSLFSPQLLKPPSDSSAKKIISAVLYEVYKKGASGTATIHDQDFQTIKIHLTALGLITVNYSKTTSGGMDLFWNLTELGKKIMTDLRSVRK